MKKALFPLAVIATFIGGAGLAIDVQSRSVPVPVADGSWDKATLLEGDIFTTSITIEGSGEQFTDVLTFTDGLFQSERCQLACDFGWTDYLTRTEGEAIHFTVTAACDEAPHVVFWEGTIIGDRMEARAVWTTSRWYWTIQRHATVIGQLVADSKVGFLVLE
jgi:hypothetical protein